MQHKIFIKTLLSLAVAAALGACGSSSTDENVIDGSVADKNASVNSSTAAIATVPADGSDSLEEINVTGARIGTVAVPQAQVRAAPAPSESEALFAMQTKIVGNADMARQGSGENYAELDDNGIHRVNAEPVSTFSIDVDTGAYSNVRRFLNNGQLPPPAAIRTEELINYFAYDYPTAEAGVPFSFATEIAASPWNSGKHLLHIGVQAVDPQATENLHSNLVFLLDVSGSMNSPDKLDLLKTSLKLLSRQLTAEDSIAIVVYAGASGVVLQPTPGNETAAITHALDQLEAGGSTNGAAGIQLAYDLAQQHFIDGGINRVLLATDGDFNVGLTDFDALKDLISAKRESGISLTTLGFGTGNYNDQLMEQLADAGNGNYAYIDNINEARKVLVDELASTLRTVAQDVKIQIEFNPAVVSEYRLIGYENRMLAEEDFNNDKVDAGEIGVGHTVTALYEISLVGSDALSVDPLRYQTVAASQAVSTQADGTETDSAALENELAYLKLRYKEPGSEVSQLLERPLLASDIVADLDSTSANYRFSAAVAGFSQLLRDSKSLGGFDYEAVLNLATAAREDDVFGYRSEFINLVKTAQALDVN